MKQKGRRAALLLLALSLLPICLSGCAKSAPTFEVFSTKMENRDTLQKLVDAYNSQSPAVRAALNAPSDPGTVLRTRLTKDRIPDVILLGGDLNYSELQSAGIFEDMSAEPYIGGIRAEYKQMLYDLNLDYEPVLYGVPYATNAGGVLYNKEIFARLSLDVPNTWEDFMKLIGDLEEAGVTPFTLTLKDAWTCISPFNGMAAALQPADFNYTHREGKYTFSGVPAFREVAEKLAVLYDHAQPDALGTGYSDGNVAFAKGQAAMYLNGNWAIADFIKANPALQVGMFAMPTTDDPDKNRLNSGIDVLITLHKESAHKQAAKDFVSFMMQPQNAQLYIDEQFAFSAIEGVEQRDESVQGAMAEIEAGRIADFVDHFYPNGFDAAPFIQEYAATRNIDELLRRMDAEFEKANRLAQATR